MVTTNHTVDWYNSNAETYFNKTYVSGNLYNQKLFWDTLDVDKPYILDLGCGSCRDSQLFSSWGASVTAIDASSELAKIAQKQTGINVEVLDMRDISYINQFDGIWACASLLHLDKNDCKIVLNKCYEALKSDGIIYISVKKTEQNNDESRYFYYYEEDELLSIIEFEKFKVLHFWEAEDELGRQTKWLNVIARKE